MPPGGCEQASNIPKYIIILLSTLEHQVKHMSLLIDSSLTFEHCALLLPDLNTRWRNDLDVFDGLLDVARAARDFANAPAAAQVRSYFRTKLSADLKLHTSWTHKFTKAPAPPPLLPCEARSKLQEQALSWQNSWQGSLTAAPVFPDLPSGRAPLPAGILRKEFQHISVSAFRHAVRSYPAKKTVGFDLWTVSLLLALPDQMLFLFVFLQALPVARAVAKLVMHVSYVYASQTRW